MMLMYALERRGPGFVLAFAAGCVLSSVYGFLAGTWPFGVVEAIWAGIAVRRYAALRREGHGARSRQSPCELGEDPQVGGQPHPLDPADA